MNCAPRERIKYDGIIVTTIVTTESSSNSNEVTFNERDGNVEKEEGSEDVSEAVFLHTIREISDPQQIKRGKREFSGIKVTIEDVKRIIEDNYSPARSPLFIVHGFNVEPSDSLDYDYSNFEEENIYYPVPVIWASEGNIMSYSGEQDKNSINAGKAMLALVNFIPNDTFLSKSLLMHSMGNHAVFNGACADDIPDVTFDNIFMVAADVPYDIFHKEPDKGYWNPWHKEVSGDKYNKATRFLGMLAKNADNTPKGKVYIVWNKDDWALWYSGCFLVNSESRIGAKGKGWVNGWFKNSKDDKAIHDDFVNYIDEFDVTEIKPTKNCLKHSYFLELWAVKFYEDMSKK